MQRVLLRLVLSVYKFSGSILVRLIIGLRYRSLLSLDDERGQSVGRVAILCPGAGLNLYSGSDEFDTVISINLAAATRHRVDYMLVERLDSSDFGLAQLEVLSRRRGKVLLKNLWDFTSKSELKAIDCSQCRYLVDVPLRLSQFLSEELIVEYMSLEDFGFSNWKSSLFVATSLAKKLGAEKISIYGAMGSGGYFWEYDDGILSDFPALKRVKSNAVHETRIGRNSDEVFLKVFSTDLASGRIEIIK